jgi:hypothetical protein
LFIEIVNRFGASIKFSRQIPLEVAASPQGVNILYQTAIASVTQTDGDSSGKKAQFMLDVIAAAYEPLFLCDMAALIGADDREMADLLDKIVPFFAEIASDEPLSLFHDSLQTYLQRDLRDLARVGDEMTFLRFIRASAARTGQLLNISDLARDADVAPNTAKSWLSILTASGIIYLLEPWHSNVATRLIKAPKLYFLDTGLASYLTEWSTPETLEAGAMSGAILETWVVGEILKSYLHNGLQPQLYFYRDKDKKEIDLLIVRDGVIYPVEVKKSASPHPSDVRNFNLLTARGALVGQGVVVCLVPEPIPLTSTATALPVGIL